MCSGAVLNKWAAKPRIIAKPLAGSDPRLASPLAAGTQYAANLRFSPAGRWSLKRILLYSLIGALVLCALPGIYAFVFGRIGKTEIKILATTLGVCFYHLRVGMRAVVVDPPTPASASQSSLGGKGSSTFSSSQAALCTKAGTGKRFSANRKGSLNWVTSDAAS